MKLNITCCVSIFICTSGIAQATEMKSFDEMIVYAPVPVPINGNTHYSQESIAHLPAGNGNISDLLRTNPAIRMDTTQSTSMNQGDIRPEKISFHGASPYQNAYLIDGISATNNLNPANDSDLSNVTNISGSSQGYYLDISLLDNITVYDSFVPVEFGHFNGGVIDARLKRFNASDDSIKLGYRTTRSSWLSTHVDSRNKDAFMKGASGSSYYSPEFNKNFYSLSFTHGFSDNTGVTAGFSRRQSDIKRADYVSRSGDVSGRTVHRNITDTALAKFTWFASDKNTHDLTLKYTDARREYNTNTFPESDRLMGNKSYGIAWDFNHYTGGGQLKTSLGWDHISDYTKHDNNIWYTERSCSFGNIKGQCTRGGLGHISQAVDNITAKARFDFPEVNTSTVTHKPYLGAEYVRSDAYTQRHNRAESYILGPKGTITNHSVYHKGKGELGTDSYTFYMADRMSWNNVSLTPGLRYDYDSYLKNHNVSPRVMAEWDVFSGQKTLLSAGYNRYYGGNILDMGLRDIRNSWTESASGSKTVTQYKQLKTPYNDEIALGIQQKIGSNIIARTSYVYREAHNQISKKSRTDRVSKTTITEYDNNGGTKTHSANLSFELVEPLHFSQFDINPQVIFSYIKSKGNLSLNSGYEDSTTDDNYVVYNGKLVSYDSVPVMDFNNPLKISLNLDLTHKPSGITWANTFTWQDARKARLALGKNHSDYRSEYSDYRQFTDKKLDSSLNWDMRISWSPTFMNKNNLIINADILNVLDEKTTVNTNSSGISTYGSGRAFWLDIGVTF
ncbi:TPA: TonB-dependent receptor plug domain-containing protein [Escherichia coli O146]|nr:TonB-dependent receptor plug domain-containing protein [Escherichia coli O146]HBC3151634.1 TonB-dependent receptor plug domain-containing protein [Escherichia coli O146]HBC3223965.1 TonB-dependent receptor plug domain-containing protein [Escherichia coli O146]